MKKCIRKSSRTLNLHNLTTLTLKEQIKVIAGFGDNEGEPVSIPEVHLVCYDHIITPKGVKTVCWHEYE